MELTEFREVPPKMRSAPVVMGTISGVVGVGEC